MLVLKCWCQCAPLETYTNGTIIVRKYTIQMREEQVIRTFVHIYTNIDSKRSQTKIGGKNLCIFVQFVVQRLLLFEKLGRNAQMCREADFRPMPCTAPATVTSFSMEDRDP